MALKLEKELARRVPKLVGELQSHCNLLELYDLENLTQEFGCIEELEFVIGKYLKTQILLKMKLTQARVFRVNQLLIAFV